MKEAVIYYNSHSGTTKLYAFEIKKYIENKGIDVKVFSIEAYSIEQIRNADYVLLGCWTSGLFFILQHPEKIWKQFAAKLPSNLPSKIALFTTYKILTGSMFKNMRKELKCIHDHAVVEFKSRNGMLSVNNKKVLDGFVAS
jgi:flavodoxin